MPARVSVAIVRQRVRRMLDSLTAGRLDATNHVTFTWTPADGLTDDGAPVEIAEEEFFTTTLPGRYRVEVRDSTGAPVGEDEGEIFGVSLRREDPNPGREAARVTQTLLHSAGAEAERYARRAKEAQDEADRHYADVCALRREVRERDARIEELEELAEAGGDDLDEFWGMLQRIASIFNLESVDDAAPVFEQIFAAIRKSEDAQRALAGAGAGAALKHLGLGGSSEAAT